MSLLVALLLSTLPAAPAASVGRLQFPISCNAGARHAFTRGLLALHSFWYDEARSEFQAAEKSDRRCAMAYWGEAMSHIELLWLDDDTAAARAALAKIPAPPKTARERAWLAAIAPLVSTQDPWPRRAAFEQAMEKLEHDYPDDESKAFLALALITEKPEFDLARSARAAALAMEVTAHNPDHPGALHYTIHALDTPELAPLALPAARRYAEVAPAAPHARHMPAHIFSRLGMWPEALASCESAWHASEAWVAREKLPLDKRDFHSFGWIIAINATMGRPHAAEQALATVAKADSPRMRDYYVVMATLLLRATGEWSQLESLLAPIGNASTAPPSAEKAAACHGPSKPQMEWMAIDLDWARLIAAAARHNLAETNRLIADRVGLEQSVAAHEQQLMGKERFARRQRIEALEDQALRAEAAHDDLVTAAHWHDAATLEDMDPPAEGADGLGGDHALAGHALLRAGKLREAKAELEKSRKRYPGWAPTWAALGEIAERLGQPDEARRDYQRAGDLWAKAEPDFAPAQKVRDWLAAHPESK